MTAASRIEIGAAVLSFLDALEPGEPARKREGGAIAFVEESIGHEMSPRELETFREIWRHETGSSL